MRDLPSGTITFLFTDIEGSTKLLHELGAECYAEALLQHRRVVRQACAEQGGVEVDTQGDAFFLAFPSAPSAAAAAQAIANELAPGRVNLRIGLHTGAPLLTEEGYVGEDVHFAARVGASGHGGSGKTRLALEAATTLVPDYKAGVFWVGFAALRDPALVTPQIAHALGAKDGLAEHIGEREMLLLIDNLEQVIEAAPDLSQ